MSPVELHEYPFFFSFVINLKRFKSKAVPDKLHKTKGIVLRALRYGETSLVVTIFTELFGVQSYLINGVRTASKKGPGKANLFQPSAMLDLVVYHNEFKQLNRIKEFKWEHVYQHILSDITKNAISVFMVELLTKCLKQPEPHADLYNFVEDSFLHLDRAETAVAANFPLFFALHLAVFFGILPQPLKEIFQEHDTLYFDLKEGLFSREQPDHPQFIEGRQAMVTAELLLVRQPQELKEIKITPRFPEKSFTGL